MSNAVVEASVDFIERLTEPSKMSKAHALETLEEIIDRLRSNCEALRDEMANEQ